MVRTMHYRRLSDSGQALDRGAGAFVPVRVPPLSVLSDTATWPKRGHRSDALGVIVGW